MIKHAKPFSIVISSSRVSYGRCGCNDSGITGSMSGEALADPDYIRASSAALRWSGHYLGRGQRRRIPPPAMASNLPWTKVRGGKAIRISFSWYDFQGLTSLL